MTAGVDVDPSGTTPAQLDLLLTATLSSGDAAVAAWDRWYESVARSLDDIDHAAARLLTQTYENLVAEGVGATLPGILRGMARHAWVRNQLLMRGAATEIAELEARGVGAMLLKGAAATASFGGGWVHRRMGDVDILVTPMHVDVATRALVERGWVPDGGIPPATVRTRMTTRRHSWGFVKLEPIGAPLALDLHWHALIDSLGDGADDQLWAEAVPVELVDVPTLAPAPTDLLFHFCAHPGDDLVPRVQAIVDVATVLRRGRSIDAERFTALARAHAVVVPIRALVDDVRRYEPNPAVDALAHALAESSPSRRERRRPTMVGRRRPRRLVERGLAFGGRYGGGRTGVIRWARGALRAHVDRPLIARPRAFAVYVASGRRAAVGRLVRGAKGPLTTTPSLPPPVPLGVPLRAGDRATLDAHGGFGWTWDTDADGAWTDGPEARVLVPLAEIPESGVRLSLLTRPFVLANRIRIDVRVNDRRVARWRFGPGDDVRAWRTMDVPARVARSEGPLELSFVIRWPQIPSLLELPKDGRRLGLFVSEIRFDDTAV